MASSSLYRRQIIADTTDQRRKKGRENIQGKEDEYGKYTPLVKAALKGDWEAAKSFFEQDTGLITAPITRESESALYLAAGTGPMAINFVKELLKMMEEEAIKEAEIAENIPLHLRAEALEQVDAAGNTPLHISAWVGNTEAAVLLVEKNRGLLCSREKRGWLPIHFAAINGKRDTLSYLLKVTEEDDKAKSIFFESSKNQPSGPELLIHVITSGYYDIALYLVRRYPQLALSQAFDDDDCGLGAIARQVNAFRSGTQLNFWKRIIYDYVPVKLEDYATDSGRVENGNRVNNSGLPVPCVKDIRDEKQKHQQALLLVRYLIKEILSLNDLNQYDSLATDAVLNATKLGIHEVVEEIVQSVPKLAWVRDTENRSLFQRAVTERHENIFNLIYQMSYHRYSAITDIDESGNTILHLAGQLAPAKKLNLITGAALQMQRELQWFKEVQKFVRPSDIARENIDKETPAMVFTREHKDLVVEGGKWMKDTATSCTISAVLIATVVFASIITVPGGSHELNGLPNFSKEKAFTAFIISDALSLFTSITSLLLFLSILTSRYGEGDFLNILPKRLIIGLVTLFLSIASMMVAFSFSLYLVIGHKKTWILGPVAAVASLPATYFVFLQFPLLVDLIYSTYGCGIFGKQSDRHFY
ncbi:hypothetical protein Vadar_011703 [Vaccinium darrowii]|uniref:Uncharacterized protein n=1 Tax=Vaccinium darrowii TaxID=229202 RepID=A0ACB7YDN7_9ERIC|nr:hypothetical protein Vadar_011703 [Vaccinium darrowii]